MYPGSLADPRGVYGSFMHPFLVENAGQAVYFTMSRWFGRAGEGKPYNVFLMEARFTRS